MTEIVVGPLIPFNISNENVEIVNGVDIDNNIVYYYQCELLDCDYDELESTGFQGEGLYVNNNIINVDEYPLLYTDD